MKIHSGNGFDVDTVNVLNKWKVDFETLYNVPENTGFDQTFYEDVVTHRNLIEGNMVETNDFVNEEISFDEIEKAISELKAKKSVGIDNIPNEIIKNHDVMLALEIV